MNGYWETAQICLNGHIVNWRADGSPERNQNHCAACGAKTITACPACRTKIRGRYVTPGYGFPQADPVAPSYCHQCGAPYPWTEKKLEAMRQMVEEADGLDESERKTLQESMIEITKDTPAAAPAAERVRKLVGKLAPKVGALLWDWSIEVASTTAAKVLKP